MKLILSKVLYLVGHVMCSLIPYDLTGVAGRLYQYSMLKSVELDTDCVLWKNPDDARVTIKGRLKFRTSNNYDR
jgi:hypothetical protein